MKSLRISVFLQIFLICSFAFTQAQSGFERAMDDLATRLAQDISRSGEVRIGFGVFTDVDKCTVSKLGQLISDELSTSMGESPQKFTIFNRSQIKQILAEHNIFIDGYIDPETVIKLGKFMSLEAVVVGTVTNLGEDVRLNVEVLDTETAAQIGAKGINFGLTAGLKDKLDQIVTRCSVPPPPPPPITPGAIIKPDDGKKFFLDVAYEVDFGPVRQDAYYYLCIKRNDTYWPKIRLSVKNGRVRSRGRFSEGGDPGFYDLVILEVNSKALGTIEDYLEESKEKRESLGLLLKELNYPLEIDKVEIEKR